MTPSAHEDELTERREKHLLELCMDDNLVETSGIVGSTLSSQYFADQIYFSLSKHLCVCSNIRHFFAM